MAKGPLPMPRRSRRCRSSSPFARCPPPTLCTALPRITPHQHLWLLRDQNVVILLLIGMVGQHCWVEYTTADQPTVTALPWIMPHQHLHLLRDQNIVILLLINMVGQHCWVEYTTADQPTVTQGAALCDCIGLHNVLLQIKFWDNGSSHIIKRQCNNKGSIIVLYLSPALWTVEVWDVADGDKITDWVYSWHHLLANPPQPSRRTRTRSPPPGRRTMTGIRRLFGWVTKEGRP
jgi:hypothetical protein